jgi:hypothetical protein
MRTRPDITTGDDDLRWVHEHMGELGEYSGQWIAVIARRIVASGTDLSAVIDRVEQQGLTDPFVTKIPDDVHRKVYFIG